MYFLTIVRTSPPQVITIYEFYRNMPAFANEDATVVEHHPRMEESEVSEEMSNLTLSSRVRPVDDLQCEKHLATPLSVCCPVPRRFTYLDDIIFLNRILLRVESDGVAVFALFLQRRRLHAR